MTWIVSYGFIFQVYFFVRREREREWSHDGTSITPKDRRKKWHLNTRWNVVLFDRCRIWKKQQRKCRRTNFELFRIGVFCLAQNVFRGVFTMIVIQT